MSPLSASLPSVEIESLLAVLHLKSGRPTLQETRPPFLLRNLTSSLHHFLNCFSHFCVTLFLLSLMHFSFSVVICTSSDTILSISLPYLPSFLSSSGSSFC
jgi:hypothetical protein